MVLTVSEITFLSVDQIDASSCGLLARRRLGNGRSLFGATDETIELQLIVVAPYVSSAKLEEDVVADLDAAIDSGSFLSTLLQYGAAYNLTLFDDAVVDPDPEPSAAPISTPMIVPSPVPFPSPTFLPTRRKPTNNICALEPSFAPSPVPTSEFPPSPAPTLSFQSATVYLELTGMTGCEDYDQDAETALVATVVQYSDDLESHHIQNTSCSDVTGTTSSRRLISTELVLADDGPRELFDEHRQLAAANKTLEIAIDVIAPGLSSSALAQSISEDLDVAIQSGDFLETLVAFAQAMNLTVYDAATVLDAYYETKSRTRSTLGFLDVALIPALVTSTSVGAVAATAASTAVPAGDPLSLVFAVQFVSLTSNIDGLPPAYSNDYAGSFAWANLQFPPPSFNRRRRKRRLQQRDGVGEEGSEHRRLGDGDDGDGDDCVDDCDYQLVKDPDDARDVLYGNILSILYAVVVGGIGRRVCAFLIKVKQAAITKAKEAKARIKAELLALEAAALDAIEDSARRSATAVGRAAVNQATAVGQAAVNQVVKHMDKNDAEQTHDDDDDDDNPMQVPVVWGTLRRVPQPNSGAPPGAESTGEDIEDTDEQDAEVEEDFEVDDPNADCPLPFFPAEWQRSSGGPSVEVNLLLVAQMGLLNSCLMVFWHGNNIAGEVHTLAAVVLMLVFVGDAAFLYFMRSTIKRLQDEGTLQFIPGDHMYDKNENGKVHYQHDAEGRDKKDKYGRKIRAVMDASVHPPVPCEFNVYADSKNHAIYYEHDDSGFPLRFKGELVVAEIDPKTNLFPDTAKPVPINMDNPEPQNAGHVPYRDASMRERIYLLYKYGSVESGQWVASSDEATEFLKGYGSAFAKFGAFGYLYYFVELSRKFADCFVLAFFGGGLQAGFASAIQWAFNFTFAFMMPYADMKSNKNGGFSLPSLFVLRNCSAATQILLPPAHPRTEITQNGGRLLTMMFVASMNIGLITPEMVAGVLSELLAPLPPPIPPLCCRTHLFLRHRFSCMVCVRTSRAVLIATVQIYANIAMGGYTYVKKAYDDFLALYRTIDLVKDLELKRVPAPVAKQLIIRLKPPIVKAVGEQNLEKLRKMIVQIFFDLFGEIKEQFENACDQAEAMIEKAKDSTVGKLATDAHGMRDVLRDPVERRLLIIEKVTMLMLEPLEAKISSLILPKAQYLMGKIMEHEPAPPGLSGKIYRASKARLIKLKRIPDPADILTKRLVPLFSSKLETFVRVAVTLLYDMAHTATKPGEVIVEESAFIFVDGQRDTEMVVYDDPGLSVACCAISIFDEEDKNSPRQTAIIQI